MSEEPVFREPWHAQAFAIAVALRERGFFTANEWAATLGDEIKRAQARGDPDTGETYYNHWLNALERLLAEKGIATTDLLCRYRDAWEHAAMRTPHGTPIELKPEDFEAAQGRLGAAPALRPCTIWVFRAVTHHIFAGLCLRCGTESRLENPIVIGR